MVNPLNVLKSIRHNMYYYFCPDKIYLSRIYKSIFGKKINWKNPTTFNEKLNWLKIYNRRPEYIRMVDKYEVKQYVADIIGEEYVIPTFGVWNHFNDIDFDKLPEQFVLKCTHDSGGLVICRDKNTLDKESVKQKIDASLKRRYYYVGREWPYKYVKPRILAEKYVENHVNVSDNNAFHSDSLPVYKFFCFNGRPKMVQVIMNDKLPNETVDYFDMDWNHLNIRQVYDNCKFVLSKPVVFDEMKEIATKLCENQPFIRVDLYEVNGNVFFSEFTFYSDCGFGVFEPESVDIELGKDLLIK